VQAATAERTEYARSRPRRDVGQRAKLGETTESLELTSLQEFVGPPGTGAPAAQPFTVTLDSQVSGGAALAAGGGLGVFAHVNVEQSRCCRHPASTQAVISPS